MRIIWKLKITHPGQEFDAPAGAYAIKATLFRTPSGEPQPVLYLMCDRAAPPAKHIVNIYGTGATIPEDGGEYAGTVTVKSNKASIPPFTMHIFHKQLGVITSS